MAPPATPSQFCLSGKPLEFASAPGIASMNILQSVWLNILVLVAMSLSCDLIKVCCSQISPVIIACTKASGRGADCAFWWVYSGKDYKRVARGNRRTSDQLAHFVLWIYFALSCKQPAVDMDSGAISGAGA